MTVPGFSVMGWSMVAARPGGGESSRPTDSSWASQKFSRPLREDLDRRTGLFQIRIAFSRSRSLQGGQEDGFFVSGCSAIANSLFVPNYNAECEPNHLRNLPRFRKIFLNLAEIPVALFQFGVEPGPGVSPVAISSCGEMPRASAACGIVSPAK